jgi:hypothetical protein
MIFRNKKKFRNDMPAYTDHLKHWGYGKITKKFGQCIRFPGRDLNPRLPEYGASIIMTGLQRSVSLLHVELVTSHLHNHLSPIATPSPQNE